MSLSETLQIDQLVIPALVSNQLVVRSTFDDLALVEHVNYIGLLDGAQPMGNSNRCPPAGSSIQRSLYDFL
jgi:hypothetical protein